MKKSRSDKIFDILNTIFMLFILFIMLYPLYFTVIASISAPYDVAMGSITFFPKGITFEAYKNVFDSSIVWTGYRNTVFYTAFGTLFNLFLTIPTAYALSKKALPGRSFLSWFFLFTMYFGGGLIPTYLIVRDLGLINKSYTMIVLGGLSVFNMIVSRIYFSTSIPESLYEAARIDGSGDLHSFFVIALPLAAPIISVMALFYGVGHWNNYFTALIYLSDRKLYPLQLVLRSILIQNQDALSMIGEGAEINAVKDAAQRAYIAAAMKYSLIFIASNCPSDCPYFTSSGAVKPKPRIMSGSSLAANIRLFFSLTALCMTGVISI